MQDPVCSAGDEEAVATYRIALESALGQASAAHPYETYGDENLSLAQVTPSLCQVPSASHPAMPHSSLEDKLHT